MRADAQDALIDVEAELDRYFADRVARAARVGPEYRILWERLRAAADGGKRIRPRLLMSAHDALGGTAHGSARTAAAAFELLHTALLLHDDVFDGDLVRRGEPNLPGTFVSDALERGVSAAAATTWGESAGVLAGDLLLSAVHTLVAGIPSPEAAELHAIIDECLFHTAAGEFADIGLSAGTMPASEADITRMMRDKTGAYSFAAPLRAGAALARAGSEVGAELAEIGAMLGVVYQLRDDLLGVFGDPATLGKPVDGDLREGKWTLLVAFAEHTDAWREVRHLFGRRSLDPVDAERLRRALVQSGARERAERQLAAERERTCQRIAASGLPATLVDELTALAYRCAERDA